MPATFHPELVKKANADGLHNVRIRITAFRKHAYYATPFYIAKSHWNPAGKEKLKNWIHKRSDANTLNHDLHNLITELRALAGKHPTVTAKELKTLYAGVFEVPEKESECKYIDFLKEFTARKHRLGKHNNAENYENLLAAISRYTDNLKDSHIMTAAFTSDFMAFLMGEGKANSTIRLYMSALKTAYKKGLEEGRFPPAGAAFDVDLNFPEKKKARPLVEQVYALIDMELPRPNLVHARNFVLMQFCLHGARFSEVLTLRWDKNIFPDRIEYLPGKKAKKIKVVERHDLINWLLDQYPQKGKFVFPYLTDADADLSSAELFYKLKVLRMRISHSIRQLGTIAGTDIKLSSHMFRHTFADEALKETNDLRMVQDLIGHGSLRSTEIYVNSLKMEEVKTTARGIYNKMPNPGANKGEQ